MALIDDVKRVCDRLAGQGWRDLLLLVTDGGLDIRQADAAALRKALLAPLAKVRRTHPGFEDFAADGVRGIEPGSPARSVLYHALAAPGVLTGPDGVRLGAFPTRAEILAVEDFVFGADPPTLEALLARTKSKTLSVVVFAYEYRPARDTCARVQADLVFSRTGVARIGTAPALYDGARRGYWPEVDDDPHAFRVSPAHYAAFLAVPRRGSEADGIPMHSQQGDASRTFWVPVHKLFAGDECVAGKTLTVRFRAKHVNDKIRRVHIALGEKKPPTKFPYQVTAGIAEMSSAPDDGAGCLVPVVHPSLVEPAVVDGEFVTYPVPKKHLTSFAAFEPSPAESPDEGDDAEVRPAPAYVHARTRVADGKTFDMSADAGHPDVLAAVAAGGYEALHYVDYTGDGQVTAEVAGLDGAAGVASGVRGAYSLVAAPDFFPSAGQRELTEWTTAGEVPKSLAGDIWGVPPNTLCDVRLPANLQLPGIAFDRAETTITGIVPLAGTAGAGAVQPVSRDAVRHSCLPDDAAGVFAPGWDVSRDVLTASGKKILHLAAYGLGSPFPEDAKLCAALSTFWPAVAPDVFRTMATDAGSSEFRATVAPLTDEEIGQSGDLPWDGVPGPRVVTLDGQDYAECPSFLHVDYVDSAVRSRFAIRRTARVDSDEYERRILAMAIAYRALTDDTKPPVPPDATIAVVRTHWFVLSFTAASSGSPEAQVAQTMTGTTLSARVFRCDMFQRPAAGQVRVKPGDHQRRLLPIVRRRTLLVDVEDGHRIVLRQRHGEATWERLDPHV
jgi:hypothetical protein